MRRYSPRTGEGWEGGVQSQRWSRDDTRDDLYLPLSGNGQRIWGCMEPIPGHMGIEERTSRDRDVINEEGL